MHHTESVYGRLPSCSMTSYEYQWQLLHIQQILKLALLHAFKGQLHNEGSKNCVQISLCTPCKRSRCCIFRDRALWAACTIRIDSLGLNLGRYQCTLRLRHPHPLLSWPTHGKTWLLEQCGMVVLYFTCLLKHAHRYINAYQRCCLWAVKG